MVRRTVSPLPSIKPWHRGLAGVVLVGCVVASVFVMLDVEDDRTSWSQHVAGAAFILFAPGAIAFAVVAPGVARRVLLAVWWVLPVAAVWVGLEHWVNWFAFYETTGRSRVTSESGARVRGSIVILLGLVGFSAYVGELRRTRRTRTR